MTTPRVLLDTSAHLQSGLRAPKSIERVEREIVRRLLSDEALTTLPIVFEAGLMYVIDRQEAFDLLNSSAWKLGPEDLGGGMVNAIGQVPEQPAVTSVMELRSNGVTETVPAAPSGLWHRAQRAGLRVATLAGREMIGWTPERARSELRLSLVHARNALVTIARPNQARQLAPIAMPPELLEPTPTTLSLEPQEPATAISQADGLPSRRLELSTIIHPSANDVVWTCGWSMEWVPLRQLAEAKSEFGFRVASLCYDMNAVFQAAWPPPGLSGALAARAIDQLDASDLIFCVSDVARRDLGRFATDYGRPTPNTRLLPLGADLELNEHLMRASVEKRSTIRARRFALSVGTLDACNNYGLLLRIWQQLSLEPLFDLDLMIAGRGGDAASELIRSIRESPVLSRRVHYVGEVADSDLADLYSRCQVFLCPRVDYAWAAPIAEALRHGRQVICSDREAHREASLGQATFIDPVDQRAWTAAIRFAATCPRPEICAITMPTWDESADVVRNGLLSLFEVAPYRST